MSRRHEHRGGCFAAFGAGLLVALLFPIRCILVLAAAALVLTGIALLRC